MNSLSAYKAVVVARAKGLALELEEGDIADDFTIDGMDWFEWLEAMTDES